MHLSLADENSVAFKKKTFIDTLRKTLNRFANPLAFNCAQTIVILGSMLIRASLTS